ncbi:MAG: Zn-dependent alcohol dehydrogenase [Thermoleophilia bacterium]|nr:Zn-dependent alcohol dehydrogenase [Thermoleophilia bacterium]
MRAAVCYEFGKPLVIEDIEMRAPRPDEVKVKVAVTAICHSDIHDIQGDLPGGLPFVGGHEVAGRVAEVGASVTSFAPGDRVIVSLLESCGKCLYCVTGRPFFCETKVTYDVRGTLTNQRGEDVIQKARVGGFAEYVLVHESQLVSIPDDLPMEVASLLACGVSTGFGAVVNRAKVPPMSSVVVIGAGGVGLNSVQGALTCGANPIIAVDILDSKLARAKEFGATHGVNATATDAVAAVRELTGGRGADYVFVTVGSAAALQQAVAMLTRGGWAVMVGLPPVTDPPFTLPAGELSFTEKTVTGAFMGSVCLQVDIPKIIALYKAGRYKLDELIAGRYPLERINEALESSAAGEVLRNVITM